jgi:hypothetical protein
MIAPSKPPIAPDAKRTVRFEPVGDYVVRWDWRDGKWQAVRITLAAAHPHLRGWTLRALWR